MKLEKVKRIASSLHVSNPTQLILDLRLEAMRRSARRKTDWKAQGLPLTEGRRCVELDEGLWRALVLVTCVDEVCNEYQGATVFFFLASYCGQDHQEGVQTPRTRELGGQRAKRLSSFGVEVGDTHGARVS